MVSSIKSEKWKRGQFKIKRSISYFYLILIIISCGFFEIINGINHNIFFKCVLFGLSIGILELLLHFHYPKYLHKILKVFWHIVLMGLIFFYYWFIWDDAEYLLIYTDNKFIFKLLSILLGYSLIGASFISIRIMGEILFKVHKRGINDFCKNRVWNWLQWI